MSVGAVRILMHRLSVFSPSAAVLNAREQIGFCF